MAGGFGLVLAIVGWFLRIPIVGWILIIVGGFVVVMAVFTFVHAGRDGSAIAAVTRRRAARLTAATAPGRTKKARRVGPQTHPTTTREAYRSVPARGRRFAVCAQRSRIGRSASLGMRRIAGMDK